MLAQAVMPLYSTDWDTSSHWRQYFVDTLGYSMAQISQLPGAGLLGVYRDSTHNQCLVLVALEAKTTDSSLTQLTELAHRYRAEFVAIGDPQKYKLFQVGQYTLVEASISKAPSWMSGFSRREFVSKSHVLLPFRDEDQLRKAFATCHDVIYTDSAKDPAAAFDLLSLVIAAKVMDEQSEAEVYHFSEIRDEDQTETIGRLTNLLKLARQWLASQDLNGTNIISIPNLRYAVVSTIFRELQNFSLILTGSSVAGTDLLGVAYEQLVGATFRGELGSYFTPRNIADFMVRLLDTRHGKVFDPSCGSGGLLTAALRYARSGGFYGNVLEIYGNDLNPRMVEAAKVNFLVHQVDPNHVLHGDGLELDRMLNRWFNIPSSQDHLLLWDVISGAFDFVLANPPFAGHEKNTQLLRRIGAARRSNGSIRSLNKTLPFLELIVASLKEGGQAGIVLPTSILNAEEDSFVRFRELLLEHVELVAIIGLPEKAFVHTDCGVHGALLFFKRCTNPRKDYEVFVGWADELGYDRLGKPTRVSDFPALLEKYHQKPWPNTNRVSVHELRSYGRWDPNWLRVARSLPSSNSADFIPLSNLFEIRNARWSRRHIRDDELYRYFEVADADLVTGRVLEVHTCTGFELAKKGRIRNQVRTGDVLLPNHRDSLMAAGAANGRSVVIVDETLNGVLTTDRSCDRRSNQFCL
jgi:tRNA1(Val) A37 N6-methylase TrmN6